MYCIDASLRIVTKSLYRTAPPFSTYTRCLPRYRTWPAFRKRSSRQRWTPSSARLSIHSSKCLSPVPGSRNHGRRKSGGEGLPRTSNLVVCFLILAMTDNPMPVLTFKTGLLIMQITVKSQTVMFFCVQNEGPACVPASNPDNGPGDVYPFPSGDNWSVNPRRKIKRLKKTVGAPFLYLSQRALGPTGPSFFKGHFFGVGCM
jgi:hypothetical protein